MILIWIAHYPGSDDPRALMQHFLAVNESGRTFSPCGVQSDHELFDIVLRCFAYPRFSAKTGFVAPQNMQMTTSAQTLVSLDSRTKL